MRTKKAGYTPAFFETDTCPASKLVTDNGCGDRKGSSHVNGRAISCESGRIHGTAESGEFAAEVDEFRRLERSYLAPAENEEWMADNRHKINSPGADENWHGAAIPAQPDRAFDDMWATFRVSSDGSDNCPFPIGAKVKMCLLHNFHIRDGMIAKEIGYEVWRCDE